MKILDRYIIVNFIKNYLISFMVLVGLYVVLDMVFNFDELSRGAGVIGGASASGQDPATGLAMIFSLISQIGGFYFYQMFVFFVHLSGVIPVVAAAFTLMRMTRFNELTAMLAAGTPLLRIAMPIIIVGLILNALLVVDQELIIPHMIPQLMRQHDELRQQGTSTFSIRAMEDDNNSILIASRYAPPGFNAAGHKTAAIMDQVDIIERDADYQPTAHVQADQAQYDRHAKIWRLTNGRKVTGLRPDQRVSFTKITEYATSIGPDEIALYRNSGVVELLSTEQINSLLEHPRSYGTIDLLRVKHWRFTQPLTNILLLLLAIPCVLTREPRSLKLAASKTVLLTGLCMASQFLAHQIAGNPPSLELLHIWPAIIAWAPLIIFGPLAIWLLDHVKT